MLKHPEEINEKIEEFVHEHKLKYKRKDYIIIDLREVSEFDYELSDYIIENPEQAINKFKEILEKDDIHIAFTNLPSTEKLNVNRLRVTHLNKLLAIPCVVKYRTQIFPKVIKAEYECEGCGAKTIVNVDDIPKVSIKCSSCKARMNKVSEKVINRQILKVEDIPEEIDPDLQIESIEVIVDGDYLTDVEMQKTLLPGKKIILIGILKKVQIKKQDKMIILANNVIPLDEVAETSLTREDIKKINEFKKNSKNVIEDLKRYVAPTIYGNEEIKEGLLLQMVGGIKKKNPDGTSTRGNIHILLVGDFGTGKSNIGKSIIPLIPRARYVSGKGASAVGITASIVRDEITGNFGLQAGAMVLANKSIIVIDEIDKIKEDELSRLYEAMSVETITITKANINATLKAETSVLAVANPKFGKFDPYEDLAKQIGLSPLLLNRFDLIFPIKDEPNLEKDKELADFMFKKHKQQKLDINFFRKYILYARNLEPEWTEKAEKNVKEFFLKLREKSTDLVVTITPRQFESLIRLSEASAKLRLSKKVEVEDTERAIRLMMYYLEKCGLDLETGKLDIRKIEEGISTSKVDRIKEVKSIIKRLQEILARGVAPIEEIKREAVERGINEDEVEEIIAILKKNGEIYEPEQDKYKVIGG